MMAKLEWLIDPLIRETTSRSDFRADDLMCALDPLTVFLSTPVADAERLKPLTRLIIQATWKPLLHHINAGVSGRTKLRGMVALLDEVAQLGSLDVLRNGLAVCAGYGIRACLVAQDERQIDEAYGSRQSITTNCSTLVVTPGYSGSLRSLEEWGGWAMQTTRSSNRRLFSPFTAGVGESEDRRPVLNTGAMLQRSRDEVLVFHRGVPPTYLRRAAYYREERWRGRYDVI